MTIFSLTSCFYFYFLPAVSLLPSCFLPPVRHLGFIISSSCQLWKHLPSLPSVPDRLVSCKTCLNNRSIGPRMCRLLLRVLFSELLTKGTIQSRPTPVTPLLNQKSEQLPTKTLLAILGGDTCWTHWAAKCSADFLSLDLHARLSFPESPSMFFTESWMPSRQA